MEILSGKNRRNKNSLFKKENTLGKENEEYELV